ncbi:MAG: copper-binding protein [Alphaproteobacteria bacterium]
MRATSVAFLLSVSAVFAGVPNLAFAQASPTKGEVKKIDEAAGKITLRHDPIANLDMDSMTMVFRVKDPAMLKAVAVGDKVVFEADRVDGALTVIDIKKNE